MQQPAVDVGITDQILFITQLTKSFTNNPLRPAPTFPASASQFLRVLEKQLRKNEETGLLDQLHRGAVGKELGGPGSCLRCREPDVDDGICIHLFCFVYHPVN